MLGNPMTIRLSPEKHARYEEAAARRGKPLGTYLRERLEHDDAARDELTALRREVAGLRSVIGDMPRAHPRSGNESAADKGLLLEILLMLRAIGGPDRTKVVRSELARLGYEIWTPEEAQRG